MKRDPEAKTAGPATVLFLGFWGARDPLTTATILPGMRLLLEEFGVRRVILGTVERGGGSGPIDLGLPGAEHLPWRARRGPKVLSRTLDQFGHVRQLVRAVRRERVGLILARASTAGSFGYSASRLTGVPLVVESFEPHADYMADVGEWSRNGALYRLSRRMELRETAHAHRLITVAHSYREQLIAQGVEPSRILVAPCPVRLDVFASNAVRRERLRRELGLDEAITGIYLGKFGGLYHKEQAFATFARSHAILQGGFRLLVLTPDPADEVRAGLARAGFPLEHAHILRAPHEQVPDYLSAADLAFALYKRTPSCAFLSPVKIGEYWANGLPVLLTRGVADDSLIIEREGGGALFDPEGDDLPLALAQVRTMIADPGHRARIASLAARHRSIDPTRRAYAEMLSTLPSGA